MVKLPIVTVLARHIYTVHIGPLDGQNVFARKGGLPKQGVHDANMFAGLMLFLKKSCRSRIQRGECGR